jgi:hypothetical protein
MIFSKVFKYFFILAYMCDFNFKIVLNGFKSVEILPKILIFYNNKLF